MRAGHLMPTDTEDEQRPWLFERDANYSGEEFKNLLSEAQ